MNTSINNTGWRRDLAAIGTVLAIGVAFWLVPAAARLVHDTSIPPASRLGIMAIVALFIVATILAGHFAWRWGETFRRPVLTLLLIALPLWLWVIASPAIGSADGFWNSLMTRAWTQYGNNPYLVVPASYPTDPYYHLIARQWSMAPMVYGPLWMFLSAIPAVLVGNNPHLTELGMKVLAAAGYLLAGWWLYRNSSEKLRRSSWGAALLAFWFLNPAALFEFGNAGHNDGLAVAGIALFVVGLARQKPVQAIVGLLGATLVKYWPLILAPGALALKRPRGKQWLALSVVALAGFLSYLPFWIGPETFASLMTRQKVILDGHLSPLLYWIFLPLTRGGAADSFVMGAMRVLPLVFLAMAAGVAGWGIWRRGWSGLQAARIVGATFLVAGASWLQPWYVAALLPLLWPLDDRDEPSRYFWLMVWLSMTVFIIYTNQLYLMLWLVGWIIYFRGKRKK